MPELSPGGLEIRPARDSDLPGLIHIDSLAYDRAAREGRFAELVAAGPGLSRKVLVAQAEGELRGFLAYQQVLDLATLLDVAVHPDYRDAGRGDALLQAVESRARQTGIRRLFVLTTRTAHWFRERGFDAMRLEDLPVTRRALYNYQRRSKLFCKSL